MRDGPFGLDRGCGAVRAPPDGYLSRDEDVQGVIHEANRCIGSSRSLLAAG